MRGPLKAVYVAAALVVLVPSFAYSQASITGLVRDASGAVLPGVTVEASSPALIEKVRSALTDGTGQYRIVDLVPGIYTVTFTLSGFSVVRREEIKLSGSFTATVNADLVVGALQETVTVSGESPLVDVQSARRQQVLDQDVISTLPSARVYHSLAVLVPGITTSTNDVGGLSGPATVTFAIHGGRGNEGRLQVDGVSVGAALNGSGVSYYVADVGNAQEITFTTSGGMGESEVGGPVMSVIPRTGGNSLRGSFFATGANESMQGDNTKALVAAGALAAPVPLTKIWDVNGAFGGPIKKDRLWYYFGVRSQGNRKYVPNMFVNRNTGDPNAWSWDPDRTQRAIDGGNWKNASVRLTWQATARNKFNIFWDEQYVCSSGCIGGSVTGGTATTSPEAHQPTDAYPSHVQQLTWRSPVTNRILLEAGFGTYLAQWGGKEPPGNRTRDLIRVTEQAGEISNLNYRSVNWASHWNGTHTWSASASYVTGAHSMKFGYNGAFYVLDQQTFTNNHRLSYRFNNGVPNQLTMTANPFETRARTQSTSFYAQEQWTVGRLTLQGGIRYDRASSYFAEQTIGPDRFVPVQIAFPRTEGVNAFNDISLRSGVSYDAFGNGKTALKMSIGRYLEAATNGSRYTTNNPISRIQTSTTRNWTDANQNFRPDCNLLNPASQDLRASGGDFCAAWQNQNFGRAVFTSTNDPAILEGWGVRPDDWSFSAAIQQEVLPRVSVEVGYYRRWFGNTTETDNLAVTPADYDKYSVTAPVDSRLPNNGGHTIDDLWNISEAKFSASDNYVTLSETFGERVQYWNGVDVNVTVRMGNGLVFQGGTSTGRNVTDECDVIIDNPSKRNCRTVLPFQTRASGLATYTVPKIDVLVSGTFQSRPGTQLSANWNVPSSLVQQTLGRPLSGGSANVTINLLEPGQMYGDRINQFDLRIAKVLRFGRTRTNVGLDLFNAFNTDAVLSYNNTYSPTSATWLRPQSVLAARFLKISAQVDF
jgi:hypothetical protein